MKLLLATHNQAKVDSYTQYLKYMSNLELVTLRDVGITEDIEETGRTFLENALLKAKFFGEKANILALGDDGGLEIHALNNEPGIHSRRWPTQGRERAGDEELVNFTINKMRGVKLEDRTANLTTTAVIYDPETHEYEVFEEKISGFITTEKPREIMPGFPYRAIFYIPKYDKLFQDLDE